MTVKSRDNLWKIIPAMVAMLGLSGGVLSWYTITTVRAEAASIIQSEICRYATPKEDSAVREARLTRAEKDIQEIQRVLSESLRSILDTQRSMQDTQQQILMELRKP